MKKKIQCAGLLFFFLLITTQNFSQSHPILVTAKRISDLQSGTAEWTTIKQFCDNNLNKLIYPGYAGWNWRDAETNYALAYQVLKNSDPITADKFAKKALALMKVLARHHNYGAPENAQLVGQGNGVKTIFNLPMTPLAGSVIEVIKTPIQVSTLQYTSNKITLAEWEPIIKISNTINGAADYPVNSYRYLYRDGLDIFKLVWLNTNHPATTATYYVTQSQGTGTIVPASQYTIVNNQINFTNAPLSNEAVFVRMIDPDYNQTGNFMGGLNSVHPDGPGYPMRTFNPGLAYGIDLLYNYSGLTNSLKTEFVGVLNEQISWYKVYGYEHDGDLGNYFIRGLVTGTMFTGYGTEGVNSSAQMHKDSAVVYMNRILTKLNQYLPGGYGASGQYANGEGIDVIELFSLYKEMTGIDLLAQTEWTNNVVLAAIHGTKPDRKTFFDGGDWSDLPAVPLVGLLNTHLTYLPNNPQAPYARQLQKDVGVTTIPAGTYKDYKLDFPLSYFCKVSSPVYARSSWDTSAVWMSFLAGEIVIGHQHRDQGHITIQKGSDYLLINGGEYGYNETKYHNTLLFDDRDAGNISVYPPGQGWWGNGVMMKKYEPAFNYVFSQADFTNAYISNDGISNSVKAAIRSVLYIRPGIIIIHDKMKTSNVAVKKIFNLNFPSAPVLNGSTLSVTGSNNRLFAKALVPANPTPVISTIDIDPLGPKRNYQVTLTGAANHNFFYVFETTAKSQTSMSTVSYFDGGVFEGASVKIVDTTWTTVFAKQDTIMLDSMKYDYTSTGNHHDVITDLPVNKIYKVLVKNNSQTVLNTTIASSPQGVLSIKYTDANPGTVYLNSTGLTLNLTALIEGLYNGSTMVSDAITVELRNSITPFGLVATANATLSTAGTATVNFASGSSGVNYYIVVKHRNSIDTWSATAVSFVSNTLSYDFTNAQSKAFESNLKLKGTKWCIYSGDVTRDGFVDVADQTKAFIDSKAGLTGRVVTDVTGDDFVDIDDMALIYINAKNVNGVYIHKPQ